MSPRWTRLSNLAGAVTALAVAACSDAVSVSTPHLELSNDIGAFTRDEVEAAINALTLTTTVAPVGTTQAASQASLVIPGCVSPTSGADSDGDGVPDNALFIFTAPPCEFTGWRGGTVDLVGQLRVQDPTPTAAGFGYEATISGLRSRFTSADGKVIYDVTRNGTRTLSGNTTGLLLTTDLHIDRTFVGDLDAEVDKQWAINYTPATGLQINGPLPSGTLEITGTVDWRRGDAESMELTLTTATPLHYNADCTDTVQRIDAGELRAAGTFEGDDGFLVIRWNQCGSEPRFGFEATE
jgi:hypothetical protein